MKFISGIKKEMTGPEIKIKIPMYHRTSIAFFNGSEVYYITRKFVSNNYRVRELILTPIIPTKWHMIRKVTINSIDSPGIINKITSTLRDLKINVNIEEALTTQIGAIHTVTLIIDLTHYMHEHNYNVGAKIPQEVIDLIEGELKNMRNPSTLQLMVPDEQVSVKELTFLESIANLPANYEISKIDGVQFDYCSHRKITNKGGSITLTPDIIKDLNLNEGSSFFYTMFSDTEEKYIKILFFDPNQTVAFIDVHHEDMYGAIAKFTEIIFKDYRFNILASYSHQQMQKETAHWYALVDISQQSQQFFQYTLAALKTAKYGENGTQKEVIDVFLMETNTDSIPTDVLMGYGQNRKTKDGDLTSVYFAKRKLLTQYLEDYGINKYLKSPQEFLKSFSFHKARSVRRLIDSIITEKRKQNNKLWRKLLIKVVAIGIPVVLLTILTVTVPVIRRLVEGAILHYSSVFTVLGALFLGHIIHNYLEKKNDEMD